jgi:Flp pilus assembly protein TadD
MAEAQEEIIIIQESDVADDDKSEAIVVDDEQAKKKKILLFGGIAILLLLIIVISLLLVLKSSQKKQDTSMDYLGESLKNQKAEIVEPSKLENMIVKANYLYSSGSKQEALSLYEQIAQYSEAVSLYNLGVAQLKDKQYKQAQLTFEKAIKNNDKRCVSAINAAVCSIYLKENENFRYYIDLAHAHLPNEIDSPLYPYYYALINYYNKNYLEALSALQNTKEKMAYPLVENNLKAKLNALFGNNYAAIEAMENKFQDGDDLSLALLYARIGEFNLAISHLEASILKNVEPVKSQMALGLINLKAGKITDATREIKNVTDMFPTQVYQTYPIKVTLKQSLFDAKKAQKAYLSTITNSKILNYQKIFYYSPYKVFNANQTISYIRKGNANIYIDNVESAQNYLFKSATSSNVNIGITKAIKQALSFKIRQANQTLKKLVKQQPKHSILQYDLALTYAQMGDMELAHEHFLRSYYLDAKNYLSGIYAILTSQLINQENSKLKSILKDSLAEEAPSEQKEFYITILNIAQNNYISSVDWLDNDYQQKPIYLALDVIISLKLNKMKKAKEASEKLTALLPTDILPHIMYIDSHFYDLQSTEYASKVLNYLKEQKFDFTDLYYGPYITRYLYIQENLITGKLYFLAQQLETKLQESNTQTEEIINALALTYLFGEQFEKAYTLYNSLIDEVKIRDVYTLFLGAIASTAAGHHGNAIALLELANLKNKSFSESRYALGLLYLELKNNEAATIQFAHIDANYFLSQYFDFEIDLDALLFKKQHPKE